MNNEMDWENEKIIYDEDLNEIVEAPLKVKEERYSFEIIEENDTLIDGLVAVGEALLGLGTLIEAIDPILDEWLLD